MSQSFCQRVRRLSMCQWSHILKNPLKGCKTPINETYLDLNHTDMCILWTQVREHGDRKCILDTRSKILLCYINPHKKVRHYMRQIDDSLTRLNRRTPVISHHTPCTGGPAQQDDEQVLSIHEVHEDRLMIVRDHLFVDLSVNSALKIWKVQCGSIERLKEEDWEPKMR